MITKSGVTLIYRYHRYSGFVVARRKMSCLVTRPDFSPALYQILESNVKNIEIWPEKRNLPKNELLSRIRGKDAIVCNIADTIDKSVLDAAGDSLKVIGTVSVGVDHIDVSECRKRGIKIGYTPDVLTDAVAELTIAILLATSRRLMEAEKALRGGDWKPGWNHLFMCGSSIKGSTVGLVGMGRIGVAILKRLKPFDPKHFLYTCNSEKTEATALGASFVSLTELLQKSDFVLICCSLNSNTKHLIDAKAISLMKSNAILINTSRGPVVEQEALVEALKTNRIQAAGLDVMVPEPIPVDHPLLSLPNAVLLPHIGSATYETREQMAILTANNVVAGLKGDTMPAAI